MPTDDRDGGLWFSLEEAKAARAALFLAVHGPGPHPGDLAQTDQTVHVLTGHHLVELTALMTGIDELTSDRPVPATEAHRMVLSEHLERAVLADGNELVQRPARLAWLLREAHDADLFVPPELEQRMRGFRAAAEAAARLQVRPEGNDRLPVRPEGDDRSAPGSIRRRREDGRFTDILLDFRRRPGMFISEVSFSAVTAFLSGCDLGNGHEVLPGFQEWLVLRGVERPERAWPTQVLATIHPDRIPARDSWSAEQDGQAIEAVFDLLYEYLGLPDPPRRRDQP